ncbi:hypothetical protein GOP47_0030701 [Adiantum capillus-veneris]|nr:hypothetical protein GOP47_0030701 [Adiantum capillus-veneris]
MYIHGHNKGINAKEDDLQKELDGVKVIMHEKRDLWLKNEGLFSAYSGFYTELEQLNKELEMLKSSPSPIEERLTARRQRSNPSPKCCPEQVPTRIWPRLKKSWTPCK